MYIGTWALGTYMPANQAKPTHIHYITMYNKINNKKQQRNNNKTKNTEKWNWNVRVADGVRFVYNTNLYIIYNYYSVWFYIENS